MSEIKITRQIFSLIDGEFNCDFLLSLFRANTFKLKCYSVRDMYTKLCVGILSGYRGGKKKTKSLKHNDENLIENIFRLQSDAEKNVFAKKTSSAGKQAFPTSSNVPPRQRSIDRSKTRCSIMKTHLSRNILDFTTLTNCRFSSRIVRKKQNNRTNLK